ncbi:MAG: hypothetical protein KIS92_03880 [Planctomycetota bacterium]|nr:hypothetical protein [Planctomycetota bacterium]
MSVHGREGWYFFKGELRHLSVGAFWGEAASKTAQATQADAKDPLAAIVHYKKQLESNGIELLLAPVPPKAVIFPDELSAEFSAKDGAAPVRLDARLQEFYKALKAEGVQVLDLTPEFLARRFDGKAPLYCKTDTHWSSRACVLAAHAIARELSARSWFKAAARTESAVEDKTQAIRGDLLLDGDAQAKDVAEEIALRFVGVKSDTGLVPIKTDAASPVLVLSDSHGLVFHIGEELFARGAGLPDQLAHELGFPVDLIASRGDGVSKVRIDLYQRAKADPAWLAGKKAVIWCFSAREFTESTNGWRKIPVKK